MVYGLCISVIVVPVDRHHSVGEVGRRFRVSQKSYGAIELSVVESFSNDANCHMFIMARNLAPCKRSHITPTQAVDGRPVILSGLEKSLIAPEINYLYASEERAFWNRTLSIKEQVACVIYCEGRLFSLCVRRNLRIESHTVLCKGGRVVAWISKKEAISGGVPRYI